MNASTAAIQFALAADEGTQFLRLWNEGEFDKCRKEWPEAPAECYVGADPLIEFEASEEQQKRMAEFLKWREKHPLAAFPSRDESKPAEQQGMFEKFSVVRSDGSSAPGGKHQDFKYFVLDLDHDPYAGAAMMAYVAACRATHPLLEHDIKKLVKHGDENGLCVDKAKAYDIVRASGVFTETGLENLRKGEWMSLDIEEIAKIVQAAVTEAF